jgi:DNA (cytosine-5)-methyltransferase 1
VAAERGPGLRLVDLFSGAGGLTAGAGAAAAELGVSLEIPLAIEIDPAIAEIYQRNFPAAKLEVADISQVFDGELGAPPTESELERQVSDIDLLVAGPPCQGHSDLNNHTRRSDPKNLLYLRAARAIEILLPSVAIIENVPGVRHDNAQVVHQTRTHLESIGYRVGGVLVHFRDLGVAQRRRRYILAATRAPGLDLDAVLHGLSGCGHERSLRWAIGDLADVARTREVDRPSNVAPINQERMAYLFEHDHYDLPDELRPPCHRDKEHSYKSAYGRLSWDSPAQTLTTGFTSMGQGRYVHPDRHSTITPHEAARIQGFPDWFCWDGASRTVMSTAIGNAVPPALTHRIVTAVGQELVRSRSEDVQSECE